MGNTGVMGGENSKTSEDEFMSSDADPSEGTAAQDPDARLRANIERLRDRLPPDLLKDVEKALHAENVSPKGHHELLLALTKFCKNRGIKFKGKKTVTYSRASNYHGTSFGADQQLLDQVNESLHFHLKEADLDECQIIFVFCTINTRIESDVKDAMEQIPESAGDKPVILVLMHHTRDIDFETTKRKWKEKYERVQLDVEQLCSNIQLLQSSGVPPQKQLVGSSCSCLGAQRQGSVLQRGNMSNLQTDTGTRPHFVST
ncbi:uncharacterized protein ACNS7B_006924 [Menidia menidia]